MRVLTWNLGYWKPASFKAVENRRRQWALLGALRPDVALLQECRLEDLIDHAPAWMGAEYRLIGTRPGPWTACSAIMARGELEPEEFDRTNLPDRERRWLDYFEGYIATASIKVDGSPVLAASVHAVAKEVDHPHVSADDHEVVARRGLERAWHSDLAAAALRPACTNRGFIVGGDWNAARLFDQYYFDEWGATSTEFFGVVGTWGWQESLRKFHPAEIRTYLDPNSRAYELDHLFTDAAMHERLKRCDVLHQPGLSELSDHTPVVADFGPTLDP